VQKEVMLVPIRRALLSVSDESGLIDFARGLVKNNVEILSTGNTARLLANGNVPVVDVSSGTDSPAIVDGRHGLDAAILELHQIARVDLLVVNLHPFVHDTADPHCDNRQVVENIEIGTLAMLRCAAKNHESVAVAVDPSDYDGLLDELLHHNGCTALSSRSRLAVKAFAYTARYDTMVAAYLSERYQVQAERFPATLSLQFDKVQDLRYGENPHQRAALYCDPLPKVPSVVAARLLQGKQLSFNNIADAEAAVECVRQFDEVTCVIVKHANPCSVAIAASPLAAYDRAYRTDPTSAFGGTIAINRELDAATASAVTERQFVEVLAVPSVTKEAVEVLAARPNIRVLVLGQLTRTPSNELAYRSITGGVLAQTVDTLRIDASYLTTVTQRKPTDEELADLLFAWRVCKFVKSNAIVYAHDGRTLGIGAGQMSRVDSTRLATMKAADENLDLNGSVMASDAFFPFRDAIDMAADSGIRAIVQTGGSKRDSEVIAAADDRGIAMVFAGIRHFRH
jgi:phosphoribosylaminoimidazolecarboxamide formyltransferase / IMP cyclohydrolase